MEDHAVVVHWFWNESFWLPTGISWEDIKPSNGKRYADPRDLLYPLPLAIVFIIVRKLYERLILANIGRYFGVNDKICKAPENKLLEKTFLENGIVGYKQIQGLAKQLDWSERQVERWLRNRYKQGKPTILDKFTESGWRCTYYVSIFLFGLYSLWDQPWFWDVSGCYRNYPWHEVSTGVWWYYIISLSFYWSLTISQFMDVKRKDFWEMFIHHWITIFLLSFSWMCNLTRGGSLVLVLHDFADPFLEASKILRYMNAEKLCNAMFGMFSCAWIISRLMVFPYVVLYRTHVYAAEYINPNSDTSRFFPAYCVMYGLCWFLEILHIIWTFFILRIFMTLLKKEKIYDSRSDSESGVINESGDDLKMKES